MRLCYTASSSMPLYPGNIKIHPGSQEFSGIYPADIAGLIKKIVLYLNECFRLAKCRHVQVGENVAQMLLCQRRADSAI